jgi:hypothetical protein
VADSAAFEPKAEFSDLDSVGTIYVSADGDFNVREALVEGGGVIIATDPVLIERLDAYEPLKRVAVARAEEAQAEAAPDESDESDSKPSSRRNR